YRMAPQQVTTPTGKTFPGYGFTFNAETAGQHKVIAVAKVKGVAVTSEPLAFFVKPYSPETVPRPAKNDILQAISKASGGQYYESLDAMNSGLASLKLRATEEKLAEFRTLWRKWPALLALMTMLATSWGLRKLRNMP
ncbi:MAG: hypothetical protein ABI318_18215, partial [Chthoniobacteraceae bacterium]